MTVNYNLYSWFLMEHAGGHTICKIIWVILQFVCQLWEVILTQYRFCPSLQKKWNSSSKQEQGQISEIWFVRNSWPGGLSSAEEELTKKRW